MPSVKKILVPHDFSDLSGKALRWAVALGGKLGGELLILHVVEESPSERILKAIKETPDLPSLVNHKVRLQLEAIAKETGIRLPKTVRISRGKAAEQIVRTAEKEGAELVVMGTHGRTGFSHLRMGSVSEKVVRYAKSPVWIHREGKEAPKRILVPLDFSENSRLALKEALRWAELFGAEVYAFHAVSLTEVAAFENFGVISNRSDLEKSLTAQAEKDLAVEVQGIAQRHREMVRLGDPVSEILEAVRGLSIDLVVIATHGRTGLKHALLGSVAENIVRLSPCSVLTVRPAAFQRSALEIFGDVNELEDYTKSFRD